MATPAANSTPAFMNRLLLVLGLGWLFDAMDVGLIAFVLPAIREDMGLSAGQAGLIGSAGLAGMLVGALAAGRLADRYGRVNVLRWALLTFGVGSLFSGLARGYELLLAARFFTGLGLGAELPVASTYLNEWAPPHVRGRYVVLLESFWAVGWVVAALVGYLLVPSAGWRFALMVGVLPAVYALFLRRALPESPRWLDRARQPMVAPASSLAAAPALRIDLVWFFLNFGYYGAFTWLPSLLIARGFPVVSSLGYVLVITVAQLPGYLLAAWLVERIGRRATLAGLLALSALSALAYANASAVGSVLFWGAALSLTNLGAWGALYAFTPELFPVERRASGVGTASAIGRAGGMLAPFLTGVMLPVLGPNGVLVAHAAALGVAALAAASVGVETRFVGCDGRTT
jgi:putative MFS transporter